MDLTLPDPWDSGLSFLQDVQVVGSRYSWEAMGDEKWGLRLGRLCLQLVLVSTAGPDYEERWGRAMGLGWAPWMCFCWVSGLACV